ncbi:MAG: hypothetical protein J07HX5_00396, partial [halophilic archaeon J07HX5]
AYTMVGEQGFTLLTAVGSVDQLDAGTTVETDENWRLAKTDDLVIASTDGQFAAVRVYDMSGLLSPTTDEIVTFLKTVISTARDTTNSLASSSGVVTKTLKLLGDSARVLLCFSDGLAPGRRTTDAPLAIGYSEDPYSQSSDDTDRITATCLVFTTEELTDAAIRGLVSADRRRIELTHTHRDEDDLIRAEAVLGPALSRDKAAAPGATLETTHTGDELAISHENGDPIPTDQLTLWVDGVRADTQPAEKFDSFSQGDRLAVEVETLAQLTLQWVDEEERVIYNYVDRLLGADAFESTYTVETKRATFTYTGDQPAAVERLQIDHRTGVSSREEAAETDTLTAGDTLTLDNVEIGDVATLFLDVPQNPAGVDTIFAEARADIPDVSIEQERNGEEYDAYVHVEYSPWNERKTTNPNRFTIRVDGEPADTQFTDEYDTLSSQDAVRLNRPALGKRVTVEWTPPTEDSQPGPIEVARNQIVPQGYLIATYNNETG